MVHSNNTLFSLLCISFKRMTIYGTPYMPISMQHFCQMHFRNHLIIDNQRKITVRSHTNKLRLLVHLSLFPNFKKSKVYPFYDIFHIFCQSPCKHANLYVNSYWLCYLWHFKMSIHAIWITVSLNHVIYTYIGINETLPPRHIGLLLTSQGTWIPCKVLLTLKAK